MNTLSRILATEFTPKQHIPKEGEMWIVKKTGMGWTQGESVFIIDVSSKMQITFEADTGRHHSMFLDLFRSRFKFDSVYSKEDLVAEFTPKNIKPKLGQTWVAKTKLTISVNDGTFGSNNVHLDKGEPVLVSHVFNSDNHVSFYKVGARAVQLEPMDWFMKFFELKKR